MVFVVVYASEQALLVWLTFSITNPDALKLVVSVFAVIVITTFTLHKLVMESRIKVLESEIRKLIISKEIIQSKGEFIAEKYNELVAEVNNLEAYKRFK